MAHKVAAHCASQSNQNEWNNDDRKDDVCNQDCEVERTNNSLPGKLCVAMVVVIRKVRNQKEY